MSFFLERMRKVRFIPAQLNNAVTVHFVLNPTVDYSRYVPPSIKLASPPRMHFALNHFRQTSLPGVVSYLESALILEVEHDGMKGNLCIAMILDDDNAMIGGREFFGFPKKMGRISFEIDNEKARGSIDRRDVAIASFSCGIGVDVPIDSKIQGPFGNLCFNIKCFPDPSLRRFDYPPRLVAHRIDEKLKRIRKLHDMTLNLFISRYDAWGEFGAFEIIEGYLREYDCTVLAGDVIAELDGDEYFPYALHRFM
jgi:acetoacetate decarboxylase